MTAALALVRLAGPRGLASQAAASHPFLSPAGTEILFVLVGLAVLGAAVLTVGSRQLVHAALWLVGALGGLAIEFLLLRAEFLAWVQVLVYVGSVVVLVLFGLMLTRAPIGPSPDADSGNRRVALGVAAAAAATLVTVVVDAFRTAWIDLDAAAGSTGTTGVALFRHWVLPFEALSVLLLAALVGAVVLSRGDRGGRDRTGTIAVRAAGSAVPAPAPAAPPGLSLPGPARPGDGAEAAGGSPTGRRTHR